MTDGILMKDPLGGDDIAAESSTDEDSSDDEEMDNDGADFNTVAVKKRVRIKVPKGNVAYALTASDDIYGYGFQVKLQYMLSSVTVSQDLVDTLDISEKDFIPHTDDYDDNHQLIRGKTQYLYLVVCERLSAVKAGVTAMSEYELVKRYTSNFGVVSQHVHLQIRNGENLF
jgi:hypothetical protein